MRASRDFVVLATFMGTPFALLFFGYFAFRFRLPLFWALLLGTVLGVSVLGAWITTRWEATFDEKFDDAPGLAIAVLMSATVFGVPALLVYERLPLVPKSLWMKCRIAARRVQWRTPQAVGFHLSEGVFNGKPVAYSLFLICRRDTQVAALQARAPELSDLYRHELTKQSVPSHALEHASVDIVSQEQIRSGGGAFHFWRDHAGG